MAGEQDWQMGLTRIHERAGHILHSGNWTDCTFIVGNENKQETVRAHRLLLAMASPVFEAMFFGGMADKPEKPIEILDVQPGAFKALLEYIYTDTLALNSFDQVCEICYAAKKYLLPPLVEQCTQYIWRDLHPGNVCRAYEFARLFEEPSLMEKCLHIIITQTGGVINDTSSFEEIEASTLRTILQQDELSVSEATLWNACERWARHECGLQSLQETPANLRKVLTPVLGLIRFLILTPTEFAQGPALSGILTQEESFTLLMNISSPGIKDLIPGFASSREKRTVREIQVSPPPPLEDVQLRCLCAGQLAEILINEQLVDCSLSFSVDRQLCIFGVELPTQLAPVDSPALPLEKFEPIPGPSSHRHPELYSELIYAFLQDSDGCRITYTHFTARVPWNSTMEVLFNRPVYIQPNRSYKIGVVLNKVGRYPLYSIVPEVRIDLTTFSFGNHDRHHDRHRDRGKSNCLIKSIIFSSSTRIQISPGHLW